MTLPYARPKFRVDWSSDCDATVQVRHFADDLGRARRFARDKSRSNGSAYLIRADYDIIKRTHRDHGQITYWDGVADGTVWQS